MGSTLDRLGSSKGKGIDVDPGNPEQGCDNPQDNQHHDHDAEHIDMVRNGSAIGMRPMSCCTAHQRTPRMINVKMIPIRVPIMRLVRLSRE